MKQIKVVYFGTPDFAVPPLQALIEASDIEVVAVVTQEDKPVGRKQELTAPPVKKLAELDMIPVLQPSTLKNNQEIIDLLQGLEADIFAVVAYGKILPQEILDIPKYGCINLHGSLLPKYRGASPVEEALLNGDTQTGITFIKITPELDAGDILLIQRQIIDPEDTSVTLRQKLSSLGAILFPDLIRNVVDETIIPIPQNHQNATFCHKISKENGRIDVYKESAEQIINKMRAYTPWPSCYLLVKEKRLKIVEAIAEPNNSSGKPGDILGGKDTQGKPTLGIQTVKGALWLQKVQLEGKNATSIQDFMRGNASFFST
jgi:methionyl-tRNA formyltransferase